MKKTSVFILTWMLLPFWVCGQNLYLTHSSSHPGNVRGQIVWDHNEVTLWNTDIPPSADARLLAKNPWADGSAVVLLNLKNSPEEWTLPHNLDASLIWHGAGAMILKIAANEYQKVRESVPGSWIKLFPPTLLTPSVSLPPIDTNHLVYEIVSKVDTTRLMASIARLQAYTTRKALTDSAFAASEWIRQQFEALGYPVELQPFTIYGMPSSPNVIATKTGTTYPDQYVVIGAHYDSYSWSDNAPGADDNASGTAGVLEAARILAGYPTEISVIFCAFSGEEYGLIGSDAYVTRCSQQEMEILGYFNLDMIAYRHPGDEIHTDMIYPPSAKPLADYYKGVAAIFVPELGVYDGFLTGGDSDHTSFNNYGYMGIFPFEDDQHYSPYIHTNQDVIGLSVNSAEMAMLFVRASLAGVSSLSGVYSTAAIHDNRNRVRATLIPNPADNLIRIVVPEMEGKFNVRIFSPEGSLVLHTRLAQGSLLSVSDLAPGIYMVRIDNGEQTAFAKLMKR